VQDETYEPLLAMGFNVLQSFEEITNAPENVSLTPEAVNQQRVSS
jgi:hypothetical protein